MSDNSSPTSTTSDDGRGASGAPDGTKPDTKGDTVSRSELEDAIRARQDAKAEARRLKEEFAREREALNAKLSEFQSFKESFEQQQRKLEEDDAAKRGDIEKLRESARLQAEELQNALKAANDEHTKALAARDAEIAKYRDTYLLENELLRVFGEVTTDPEVALLLLKDRFELAENEHGRLVPRPKDSTLDLKSYSERELEGRGKAYLLKSQRRSGTGAQQQPASGTQAPTGGQLTAEQISKLPDRGAQYFKDNPKAAKEFLNSAKLKG